MPDEQTIAQQDVLSPLLEGVRRRIPGSNPCGRDISYEEDFLAVKPEIDKMSTVNGQIDQERRRRRARSSAPHAATPPHAAPASAAAVASARTRHELPC